MLGLNGSWSHRFFDSVSPHLLGEDRQSRTCLYIYALSDSTSPERRMPPFSYTIFWAGCTAHPYFSTGLETLNAQISFSSTLNLIWVHPSLVVRGLLVEWCRPWLTPDFTSLAEWSWVGYLTSPYFCSFSENNEHIVFFFNHAHYKMHAKHSLSVGQMPNARSTLFVLFLMKNKKWVLDLYAMGHKTRQQ